MSEESDPGNFNSRRKFVLGMFGLGGGALLLRDTYLQVVREPFLMRQGDVRHLRTIPILAHRGMVLDRNRHPLAISTPVKSIWIDPAQNASSADLARLAGYLQLDPTHLQQRFKQAQGMSLQFMWVKRQVPPYVARNALAMKILGLGARTEYKRYYPMGEVGSHLLGFTNISGQGQDGLELEFDAWMAGASGSKQVVVDAYGQVVEDVQVIKPVQPGRNLATTIDQRIQYLAYVALEEMVRRCSATSGSVVVMDPRNGEIVAMVDQPSFNPNIRSDFHSRLYRNRAATDAFEPGSTMKPFTLSAALMSGQYTPSTKIDTSPGWYMLDGHTIKDDLDFGTIDLTQVLQFSSNVAASKIAITLPAKLMWGVFERAGFGQITHSGFPGETSGMLHNYLGWKQINQATIAYGYDISVTTLQLAEAYCAIANGGVRYPATFVRRNAHEPGIRVMPAKVANTIRHMLRSVITPQGTAYSARIPGYTVAGKTGTAYRVTSHGFSKHDFNAVFVGMVPASNPRLVAAVVVRSPQKQHLGGQVAAPVFQQVMSGAMRLWDIPPDDLKGLHQATGRHRA